MDRLQTLDLINNKLAAIDEGINGLASLKELYLDNNQLVRFTPNTFSQLANLTLFSMNGNQLEELPLGLLQCQQLE
jgi:Leucine-rich repeat (LRR) protein